jgi:hypothetical protein
VYGEVASYTHLTYTDSTIWTCLKGKVKEIEISIMQAVLYPVPLSISSNNCPQIVIRGRGRLIIRTFRMNGESSALLVSFFILPVFPLSPVYM